VTITHAFVSAKPDTGYPDDIQPSHWNADHLISDLPLSALAADARGMELLAGGQLSRRMAHIILTFTARDLLLVLWHRRTTGGQQMQFQFNDDTGANYWYRALSALSGGNTWSNSQTINATSYKSYPLTISDQGMMLISNQADKSKPILNLVRPLTESALSAGTMVVIGGEWVNSTQQITKIRMFGGTLDIDSDLSVWGKNL